LKPIIAILAALIVIGGGFWLYVNNNNNFKTTDNMNDQAQAPASQNNFQPPSKNKQGDFNNTFKFSCSQIASTGEVRKIFSENISLVSDPIIDAFKNEKTIFCQYGTDNLGSVISVNTSYFDSASQALSSYETFGKYGGARMDTINVGIKGFYFYPDKNKNLERTLIFADNSDRFLTTIMAEEKFTHDKLISLAKLVNGNLNK